MKSIFKILGIVTADAFGKISMRFQHLDLNLLVALDVLLTEKNVTRAADVLCLSQSATSGLLAKLREFFNDEILVTQGRKMFPTPFALSIEEHVRRILLDIQRNIINHSSFDEKQTKRKFRFMASDYVSTVFITKLANQIADEAPNISLDVISSDENYDELLSKGEIDFLIHPAAFTIENYPKLRLFQDDYLCITSKNNSVLKDQALAIKHYCELGHVAVNIGYNRALPFEEEIAKLSGHERRIEIYANNFCSIPFFVSESNRIGILQSLLIKKFEQICGLQSWPVPIEIPPLVEYLQWNPFYSNDPGHMWLRSKCLEAATSLE